MSSTDHPWGTAWYHDILVWTMSCFLVAACSKNDGTGIPVSKLDSGTIEAGIVDGEVVPTSPDLGVEDVPSADAATAEVGSGCPVEPPSTLTDAGLCDLPAEQECVYPIPCTNGTPNKAIFWCSDGVWKSVRDLGCSLGTLPLACTGACETPASRCKEVAEVCPGNENLFRSCLCTNGSWTNCFREYDCNPPSTCVSPDGDCLYRGMQNWSTKTGWCPEGTPMRGCAGRPCTPDSPRPRCIQTGGESHSAACVYGQWACLVGFTGPTAR